MVEIVKDDKPPIATRLFVNVQPVAPKKQGEFVAFDVALGNKDYRQQVLNNALIELRAFQRKYFTYSELASVFKSIDDFADTLE